MGWTGEVSVGGRRTAVAASPRWHSAFTPPPLRSVRPQDDMLAKRRAAAQPQEPASAQVAAAASDAPAAEAPSTPANPDKGEAGSAGKPLRRRT